MKINYIPDIQHIIREGPVMIYKHVDSACPLFLVSRYLSAIKMFALYKNNYMHIPDHVNKIYDDKYSPFLKNVSITKLINH